MLPLPAAFLPPAVGRRRARSRWALLAAAAVAVCLGVTGCTDTTPGRASGSSGASAPAPDAAALGAALDRETELLGQAVELGLTDAVRVLTTHVAALASLSPGSPTEPGTTTSSSGSPTPPTSLAPASLTGLHEGLVLAADQSLQDVTVVTDGGPAALLASVAASDEALALTVTRRPQPPDEPADAAFAAAAALPPGARPPSGTETAASALMDAWQTSLGSEHAAVYGFGLVGGRLPATAAAARWCFEAHRARRDALADAVTGAGGAPSPAAAAYVPDRDVVTVGDARQLAASIERDSLASYAGLVTAGDTRWRTTGATWLRAATLTLLGWSGQVAPLPGMSPPVVASDRPTATSSSGPEATP